MKVTHNIKILLRLIGQQQRVNNLIHNTPKHTPAWHRGIQWINAVDIVIISNWQDNWDGLFQAEGLK